MKKYFFYFNFLIVYLIFSTGNSVAAENGNKKEKINKPNTVEQIKLIFNSNKGSKATYTMISTHTAISEINGKITETMVTQNYQINEEIVDVSTDGIIYKNMFFSNVQANMFINGKRKKKDEKKITDSFDGKSIWMKLKLNGDIIEQSDVLTVTKEDMKGETILGIGKGLGASLKLAMNEEDKKGIDEAGVSLFTSLLYFPTTEVKIGESWTKEFHFAGLKRKHKYIFEGFNEVNGANYAIIRLEVLSEGVTEDMVKTLITDKKKISTSGQTIIVGEGKFLFDYKKGVITKLEYKEISTLTMIAEVRGYKMETETESIWEFNQNLIAFTDTTKNK